MFSWVEDKDLIYLNINSFLKYGVEAYFTTRIGGVSPGKYNSLNLALHVDDKKDNILINREIIANSIGIDSRLFVAAEQVHGAKGYIVTKDNQGAGAIDYHDSIPGADAIITEEEGIPLISFYADCVPLFFVDPVKRVVALAHAGWRGTVKKIARETVLLMKKHFSTEPENILAAIGPSISKDYYEVNNTVIREFKVSFQNYRDLIVHKGKEHYLLDLCQANKFTLEEVGIPEDNIYISNFCTFHDSKYFYSYRREKGKTGRMASIIYLQNRD